MSQNRLREKGFLARNGFPGAVETRPYARRTGRRGAGTGQPLILKTAASGYDGKGQARVDDLGEIDAAWSTLGRVPCVARVGWCSRQRSLWSWPRF